MPNKKTLKRNKRKNSKRGKSIKGGFLGLFKDKDNDYYGVCNQNNLTKLNSTIDINQNIDTCCPKTWYGRKNNSPYCKAVYQKYDAGTTRYFNRMNASSANGVYTDENDPDGLRPSDVAHLESALSQHNTIGDDQINCKDKRFANSLTSKEKIAGYIETCECNKTRWNPFSKKRQNCSIVKKKLEELTKQKNNETDSETDSETDDEDENQKFVPQYDSTTFDDAKYGSDFESSIDYPRKDLLNDHNYKKNYYASVLPVNSNPNSVVGGKKRRTNKRRKTNKKRKTNKRK